MLSNNIPRFVDIIPKDYYIDVGQMEAMISEPTREIIAIHLFGYPLNMDRLG